MKKTRGAARKLVDRETREYDVQDVLLGDQFDLPGDFL